MRINGAKLSELIEACFEAAMDGRFSQQERLEFLALGKRLRGSLVNLLSAQFQANEASVLQANSDLATINQRLAQVRASLAGTAQVVQDISTLVGNLDGLLKLAVAFV